MSYLFMRIARIPQGCNDDELRMGRKGCSRTERSDKIVLGEKEEDKRCSRKAETLRLCNKRVWKCSKMGSIEAI